MTLSEQSIVSLTCKTVLKAGMETHCKSEQDVCFKACNVTDL